MRKSPIAWVPAAMAAILLLWLAIRLAQPIADTDVFWHMVYAKQMIARHTLRTDHTLYSWMPSSNEMMYCAWLSEMLLLGLWNWSGIAGLAVLRYSAVLLTVVLPAWFAWRAGILRLPFTWLLILFATILGLGATQPKPELFSLLMWHVLLFCYFRFRLAIRQNTDTTRWLYAMPALMLLWVNLHGGFILAGPFLAVTLVAEWIPAWAFPEWLRPAYRLPQVLLRKMTLAWAAALLAIAVTPYGPQYPLQLFADLVLHRTPRPDGIWNSAMQSSFSVAGFNLHLPEFLAFMALVWIVLLTLSVRRGPVDWLIPALNLIYVPLYIAYLRSTFLLPVLFAFSVIWWISAQPLEIWSFPRARLLRIAPLALFLFWIGRSTYELRANPEGYTWIGFGFGYMQPVAEAEFVANLNLGPRLYNMYNSGGYLIWRLYPQYQVMCDPRSFPYLSWFHELYNFTRQASKEEFQQFLARHPANVALIDLSEPLVWRNFLQAPGWYPAYYGPTAAVFVKDNRPAKVGVAAGVMNLHDALVGFHVFEYAVAVADFRTAWAALDQLNRDLRISCNPKRLAAALLYREAHAAVRRGDYARAEQSFLSALEGKTISDRDALMLTLLRALREAAANPTANVDQIAPALRKLAAPQ